MIMKPGSAGAPARRPRVRLRRPRASARSAPRVSAGDDPRHERRRGRPRGRADQGRHHRRQARRAGRLDHQAARRLRLAHVEGSSRPTVNGNPLVGERCRLKNGDVIELAGTQMQFVQA